MKKTALLSIIGLGTIGAVLATGNVYPIHSLPPKGWGVANPNITQENIEKTICNPSWHTSSIRPPSSYTSALKIKQLKDMGYADQNPSHYEEDHIESLEIGGAPKDPKNLWPEPYNGNYNAHGKDKTENYLHDQVCNGEMTLQEAQTLISTDWIKVYNSIK